MPENAGAFDDMDITIDMCWVCVMYLFCNLSNQMCSYLLFQVFNHL